MLKYALKTKTLFTIVIASVVIVLGLFGTSWQIGFAQTNPTLPIVESITPDKICVGSDDVNVTIKGSNFIDEDYTWISWLGPNDTSPTYIIPEYVSLDGKVLRFWVESFRLTDAGKALVMVVNHPQLEKPFEIATFYIDINHCIFLSLIMK